MQNTMSETNATNIESFAAELGSLKSDYESLVGPVSGGGESLIIQPERPSNLSAVMQIPVEVKAVLGSANVPISTLMKMRRGTVLPLERRVGEPIELMVNGRVVARGEVVVLEDGAPSLGISLTEIVGNYGNRTDDATPARPVVR